MDFESIRQLSMQWKGICAVWSGKKRKMVKHSTERRSCYDGRCFVCLGLGYDSSQCSTFQASVGR